MATRTLGDFTPITSLNLADLIYTRQSGVDKSSTPQDFLDLLLPLILDSVIPVGFIIQSHESFPNTPTFDAFFTSHFKALDGSVISDIESPYNGQTLPNWNGDARFLRGGSTTGTEQLDAFQGHQVRSPNNYATADGGPTYTKYVVGVTGSASNSNVVDTPLQQFVSDGVNGTPRVDSETRPINATVKYYMRIK